MPSSLEKEYACHKCGFGTDIVNFNNHSCRSHKCKKCEVIFNSVEELINHICPNIFTLKHFESKKAKNIYVCLKCNFICKSNGALKLHNNIHFKGKFKCLYCDFATNFENLLKMHWKNCDAKPTFSSTINEETNGKYSTWSYEEMLEIYWCDMYARGLSSGKAQGNLGQRRRKLLKDRGNVDPIKLGNTSDLFFYVIVSHIRSGRTIITKEELKNVVDNVCKCLKYEKIASKSDKASSESKDGINFERQKSKDCVKPEPAVLESNLTLNHVFVKKSRRNIINYKDQSATKDISKAKDIKKEEKKTLTKKRENPPKNKGKNKVPKERWFCHKCCKEKVADMVQCIRCLKWYHEECVGLGKEDLDVFVCPDGCS